MKTIQIEDHFDKALEKLKINLKKPKKTIVQEAIEYIRHHKIDPANLKDANPTQAIQKLRNDLIAYIKTHETKKIQPLLDKLTIVAQQMQSSNIAQHNSDMKIMKSKMIELINALNKLANQVRK